MKKLIITVIAMATIACSGKGIVVLEGYEHGVAFCENTYSVVVHKADSTVWADGTASYVVNAGHHKDRQVKDLVDLAHKHCAQYYK